VSVPVPNYTQVPNVVFEHMGDMTEAELKVVLAITRETIGYHRERRKMSLTRLQEMTGLNRQSVIVGVQRAIHDGFVKRFEDGQSYSYELNIFDDDGGLVENLDQSKLVENLDQKESKIKTSASRKLRPDLVLNSDQSSILKETVKESSKETVKESTDGRTVFSENGTDGRNGETIPQKLARIFDAPQVPKILEKNPDLLGADVDLLIAWVEDKPARKAEGIKKPEAVAYDRLMRRELPFNRAADEPDDPARPGAPPPEDDEPAPYDEAEQYIRPTPTAAPRRPAEPEQPAPEDDTLPFHEVARRMLEERRQQLGEGMQMPGPTAPNPLRRRHPIWSGTRETTP
jgi:phage replication O-like protein O